MSEFLGLAISGLQQIKNCHYSKTATTPWCSILLVLPSSKYPRVSNKRTVAVSIPWSSLNPKWCGLCGGVLFGEMKFALSNFLSNGYHYVLRVLKTFLWDPRCQTYIFKTKITQGIQKWVQKNQLPALPSNDFFKKLFLEQ